MNKVWFGWAGRILYVNLDTQEIRAEPLTEELAYGYLGQSGINAKLLYDLTGPETDPLGPDNPLIIGVGPLAGTMAPSSGRFTVTAKSPLTGVFGDSNCGGHWGPELKFAGYDHMVISGRAEKPVYLWINDDKVELRPAEHVWGKDTWETDELLKREVASDSAQVLAIGPAGENLVRFAAIMCNLTRAAARTGMGAVMGSKKLKAIVVKGSRGVSVARPQEFWRVVGECEQAIKADPMYEPASTFGTSAITGLAQMLGFLPTENFRKSTFEEAENLRGEVLLKDYDAKHKGCFNCAVSCSRFYRVSEGEYAGTVGEGPEYESLSALGTKCGNGNLPSVLKANTLCNKLGLDTISTGNVIALAMECGEKGLWPEYAAEIPAWGDHARLNQLLQKIAFRQGLGDVLAEGSALAALRLGGFDAVVQSKGMDYPAVDVRGTKGMALAFAVSPRGGDHLKGLPLYEVAPEVYQEDIKAELGIEITPKYWLEYESKARLIAWHEDWHCVVDSLGLCKLEGIALKPLKPRHFRDLLAAATGWEVSEEELRRIGARIWNLERVYGVREGVRKQDDLPPYRLWEEPISTGPSAGERLDHDQYLKMLAEYYELRGWDQETGVPQPETLHKLELPVDFEGQGISVPKRLERLVSQREPA